MKIHDLTHPIEPQMPVYPGTRPPVFSQACTIKNQGFAEKQITLFSHTGTHMDAPSHILPDGKSLDQFPPDRFMGKAFAADATAFKPGEIQLADLIQYESILSEIDFLLFYTGWDQKWGKAAYFEGYPVLSTEAAHWLTAFALYGIGVDMISVDAPDSDQFPIHQILMQQEILIIENLTGLQPIVNKKFTFFCPPLKIQNADGSPVRALAHV